MFEWFTARELYTQVVIFFGAVCVLLTVACVSVFLTGWVRGQMWVRKQRREHR